MPLYGNKPLLLHIPVPSDFGFLKIVLFVAIASDSNSGLKAVV